MRKRILAAFVAALFLIVLFALAGAEETKHEYIGAKKCKMCHKKDGTFESWLKTKHATAWDDLSDEDKKKDELKPFYTTGANAKGELLTGVQCEACHGPGADYKKKSIMQDREKAMANGLMIPTAEACQKCHNDKAPGVLAATAKDFDFEKMKAKGAHALPTTEKKTE